MSRIRITLRMPWFSVLASGVALVVRFAASFGQSPVRYPDSIGYDTVNFFATTDRPWPIPLVFALAGSDAMRMVFHVVLGTAAWVALAWVLSLFTRFSRGAFAVTLLLGLSPQVIRYDVAMLSESLSITFAVAAVAATLFRYQRPSATSTTLWGLTLVLVVLSRPAHLLIVVVFLTPFVVRFVRSRGRKIAPMGVALLVLLGIGTLTVRQSSHMSLLNLYTVVSARIISDDSRFEWFVSHGMPNIPGMREAGGYDYAGDLPPEVDAIVKLPKGQQPPSLMRVGGVELARWLTDNGWRTMVMYLATHPTDAVSHARQLADPTLNPANDDFLPLENGPMLPRIAFLQWQLWALVGIMCVVALGLRRDTRRIAALLGGFFLAAIAVFAANVHTSGIEHARHATTVSAMIRVIGLVCMVAVLPRKQISATRDGTDDEP